MSSSDEEPVFHDAVSADDAGSLPDAPRVAVFSQPGRTSPVAVDNKVALKNNNKMSANTLVAQKFGLKPTGKKLVEQDQKPIFLQNENGSGDRPCPDTRSEDDKVIHTDQTKAKSDLVLNTNDHENNSSFSDDTNGATRSDNRDLLHDNVNNVGNTGYEENEENIYDSVHFDKSINTAEGFEVIGHEMLDQTSNSVGQGGLSGTTQKRIVQEFSYEWKRREAKKKSRALRRTPSGKA